MAEKSHDGDVQAIRALMERWTEAVRREDLSAIRADHDPDILMFDVPPPFLSRGLDAYMSTWRLFFSSVEKPVSFSFEDIEVTAGLDVALSPQKETASTLIGQARGNLSNSGSRWGSGKTMANGASCMSTIRFRQQTELPDFRTHNPTNHDVSYDFRVL